MELFFTMKLKKQPVLACPIDSIGASARPRAAWVHQIHAAAGVGGSTTMVMVFVR